MERSRERPSARTLRKRETIMRNMEELTTSAREDLRQWAMSNVGNVPRYELDDQIHEVADGHVPVYTAELMQLFVDNVSLAMVEPELGHGTAGNNMVGMAQAIVYEELTADLHTFAEELWDLMDAVEEAERTLAEAREELEELTDPTVMVELSEEERADRQEAVHTAEAALAEAREALETAT
jgi:hypothetical protein